MKRYSLGTKNRTIRLRADGSLTIYVQHDEPAGDKLANWLPAAAGEFSLYLRAHWPDDATVGGRWTPPAAARA